MFANEYKCVIRVYFINIDIRRALLLIQIDVSQEMQFLTYLIPVILGNQLMVYFFYQYKKNFDTNLKLNRILLSYALFMFFRKKPVINLFP